MTAECSAGPEVGPSPDDRIISDLNYLLSSFSAPVALAEFRTEAHQSMAAECPICRSASRSFLSVTDMQGSTWDFLACSGCNEGEGGVLRNFGKSQGNIEPGHIRMTHALGQGAADRRWDGTEKLLRDLPVREAEALVNSALLGLETEQAADLSVNYIGGGLGVYEADILDAEAFRTWEGANNWVPLCVIDHDRGVGPDTLVAAIHRSTGTGFWVVP